MTTERRLDRTEFDNGHGGSADRNAWQSVYRGLSGQGLNDDREDEHDDDDR